MSEIIRRIKAAWAALYGKVENEIRSELHDALEAHLKALRGEIRTEFAAEINKLKRALARKVSK